MAKRTRDSFNPISDRLRIKADLLNSSYRVLSATNDSVLLVRLQIYLWSKNFKKGERRTKRNLPDYHQDPGNHNK